MASTGRRDLVVMAVIAYDVDGLDDVDVFQACTDTKLSTDFLLVVPLRFAGATWSKLLDGIDCTAFLCTCTNEPDSTSCARTKDAIPFAILF